MSYRILLVGNDASTMSAARLLADAGFGTARTQSSDVALTTLSESRFDGVLACIDESARGLEALRRLSAAGRREALVALGDVEHLAAASSAGAIEFVSRPASAAQLSVAVSHAIEHQSLALQVEDLARELAPLRRRTLVGDGPRMVEVRRVIAQVCACDVDMLVSGEQGTGKKLIAAQIHQSSRRADGPLVFIDLADMPREQHEVRLFGNRKDAGALVAADSGTLVMQEPASLGSMLQDMLLQSIREGRVPVRGGSVPIDVRVIALSERKLEHMAALDEFSRDLYARLATVSLTTTPLRERGYDVLQLAAHFVASSAGRRGIPLPRITTSAVGALLAYDWPGNVRELEDAIDEAVAKESRAISANDLPERVVRTRRSPPISGPPSAMPTLDDVERRYITEVMRAVNGNKSRASRVLGVDRRTLYRMLRRLDYEHDGGGSGE